MVNYSLTVLRDQLRNSRDNLKRLQGQLLMQQRLVISTEQNIETTIAEIAELEKTIKTLENK